MLYKTYSNMNTNINMNSSCTIVTNTIGSDSSYDARNKDTGAEFILESCRMILEPLMDQGWQMGTSSCCQDHSTKFAINKKYNELEEINIEYKNSFYHFSVPIHKSAHSYYKRFDDGEQALKFLENYIHSLY